MTKMSGPAKVLLVEDDMIIAADISVQLTKLGYEIIGIQTRAEDALSCIADNRPDIILMDIVLSGQMNGIEAARLILEKYALPVIFLTSNYDDATFQRALSARPHAFIAKPFQKSDLERTLRVTLQRMAVERRSDPVAGRTDHISNMDDRLFIRLKDQLVKVLLSEILYVEADRNYCSVFTEKHTHILSVPLRNFAAQLPVEQFVRVHRSFVVNLRKIDSISEFHEYLTIQNSRIPIARRSREEVTKRLNLI